MSLDPRDIEAAKNMQQATAREDAEIRQVVLDCKPGAEQLLCVLNAIAESPSHAKVVMVTGEFCGGCGDLKEELAPMIDAGHIEIHDMDSPIGKKVGEHSPYVPTLAVVDREGDMILELDI